MGFSRNLLDIISEFELNLLAFAYDFAEFCLALPCLALPRCLVHDNNKVRHNGSDHLAEIKSSFIYFHQQRFVYNECKSIKCLRIFGCDANKFKGWERERREKEKLKPTYHPSHTIYTLFSTVWTLSMMTFYVLESIFMEGFSSNLGKQIFYFIILLTI